MRKDRLRRENSVSDTCARKVYYPSREAAEYGAAKSEYRHDVRLSVYQCPYCHGWHLTSHPRHK